MGYKTTVQLINRKKSEQYFINFPSACAQMLDLRKGEQVEWVITEDGDLLLKRSAEGRKRHARKSAKDGEN